MSNTPRTDRYELYYIETGNVSKLFNLARELESELAHSKEANAGLMRACDNLERELAEVKIDRDEWKSVSEGRLLGSIDKVAKLEQELAEVTKQRDHYKAACDQYSEDEMLCKLQEVTKQRDALAEVLESLLSGVKDGWFNEGKWWHTGIEQAEQALAAVKGGSHEKYTNNR